MKYIKSRSNFLSERKKYNLILEGGLENDINWGDSLLGRLFMSVFRMGSNAINSKRIDGLANSLRNVLSEDVRNSITDENPELEEEINKLNRRLVILSNTQGLLQVLKTANIQQIQLFMEGMSDDNIVEVINKLTNKDKDSIGVLLAIQEWTKKEEKEEEEGGEEGEEEGDETQTGLTTTRKKDDETQTGTTASSTSLVTTTGNGDLSTTSNTSLAIKTDMVLYNKIIKNLEDIKDIFNDKDLFKKYKEIEGVSFVEKGSEEQRRNKKTTKVGNIEDAQLAKKFNLYNTSMLLNEDINFNTDLINNLINSEEKNQIINIYKIVSEFLKGVESNFNLKEPDGQSDLDKMIDKFKDLDRDKGRLKLICEFARSIARFYYFFEKINIDNSNVKKFIQSMKDVLSEINNKKIEYISEAVLSDFFLKESGKKIELILKDNKIIDEISFSEETDNITYNYWINNYLKPSRLNEESTDIEKKLAELSEKMNTPKYVINVLEIVKIFKDASRIYIKTVIPSQRTNGKITRAVANQWETTSGGSVDPDRPSGGPFRNIKLYEKWNKLVIDVIDEFDYALKREDSRIVLSRGDKPIKPKKSIYDFIIEALEGDKISGIGKSGTSVTNQLEFLRGYFGDKDAEGIITTIKNKYGDDTIEKPKEKENQYIEESVEKIDFSTSGLYKLSIDGYLEKNSGSGHFPMGEDVKEIYLYFRKKDNNNKYGYLFQNPKIIERYKTDSKNNDDVKGNIYVVKIDDTSEISKGKNITNIDSITYKDKKVVKFGKTGPIKIDKIDKIKDTNLSKLEEPTDEFSKSVDSLNPFTNK